MSKDLRVYLGFGMGNISSLTLPFATGLKQNDITTVFAIPQNVPGFKELFEGNQAFTVNLVDREKGDVFSSYAVKACNNVNELETAIKQSAAQKDGVTHVLYPSEAIGDVTKVAGVQVAGAFSAVGPKPMPIVLAAANEIAGKAGAIPFYLCENLSQAKLDALSKPGVYPNLKIRNCVIDRTSGDQKVAGNLVTIGTEPAAKCGGIMYESRPGDEKFAGSADGIAFQAMSTEKITAKETVKWVGINLVDYLIARYVAKKALGENAPEFVFENNAELANEKIGKFIDSATEKELKEMLGYVNEFLGQYGLKEDVHAFSAARIENMRGDTFGRILKLAPMEYYEKLRFCQGQSISRGLVEPGKPPEKESVRYLKKALSVQKAATSVQQKATGFKFK